MRCASCHEPVRIQQVFPGGRVLCTACGAQLKVPEVFEVVAAPAATSPYRQAAVTTMAVPERAAPEAKSGPQCPRCPSSALELGPWGEDWACHRCEGLFITHARLEALVYEHRESGLRPTPDSGEMVAPSAPAVESSVSYLPCPVCASLMNRRNFADRSGIIVDVCKQHGIWFDKGELDAVIAFAFDLPEGSEARAALMALVRRALPPPPPRPPPSSSAFDVPLLARRVQRMHAIDVPLIEWLWRMLR